MFTRHRRRTYLHVWKLKKKQKKNENNNDNDNELQKKKMLGTVDVAKPELFMKSGRSVTTTDVLA